MSVRIFLGKPPANIENFIKNGGASSCGAGCGAGCGAYVYNQTNNTLHLCAGGMSSNPDQYICGGVTQNIPAGDYFIDSGSSGGYTINGQYFSYDQYYTFNSGVTYTFSSDNMGCGCSSGSSSGCTSGCGSSGCV